MQLVGRLPAFDVFSKTDSSVRIQTREGALLSVVALSVMAILFCYEFSSFLSLTVAPTLLVDTEREGRVKINLDVTFPKLPCGFLSVNSMDKAGNHQLDVHHNLFLTRLQPDGNPVPHAVAQKEEVGADKHEIEVNLADVDVRCGNCYGAQTLRFPCCDTCEEVQEAYRRKGWAFTDLNAIAQCVKEQYLQHLQEQKEEGCNVRGFLTVGKVAGNINIVPGKFLMQNARYVVDSYIFNKVSGQLNISNVITHLSFGEEFPGMHNPLDGEENIWTDHNVSPMYEYFVNIVPTVFESQYGDTIWTNQYSFMKYIQKINLHSATARGVPGFFIMYDFSPIIVEYRESSKSFLHFLTNIFAIIGGIFTVFRLIDSLAYSKFIAKNK